MQLTLCHKMMTNIMKVEINPNQTNDQYLLLCNPKPAEIYVSLYVLFLHQYYTIEDQTMYGRNFLHAPKSGGRQLLVTSSW